MKRRLAVGFVIMTELITITVMVIQLYRVKQYQSVLGAIRISPIRKEYLLFSGDEELQYFYEPMPDINEIEKPVWLPFGVTYTINNDSLNDRYTYATQKPPDVFRIITLGDSFTFGHFVNTSENWTEKLEDTLNTGPNCPRKYEVINLGVRGYDIHYAVQRFLRRGKKYNPDLVIWLLKDDDFLEINEKTTETESEILKSIDNGTDPLDYKNYYDVRGAAIDAFNEQYDARIRVNQQEAFVSDLITSYQGPVLIASFRTLGTQFRQLINLWSTEYPQIRFFGDIPDIYTYNESFRPNDFHPNPQGHTIIARDLYRYLGENKMITCY